MVICDLFALRSGRIRLTASCYAYERRLAGQFSCGGFCGVPGLHRAVCKARQWRVWIGKVFLAAFRSSEGSYEGSQVDQQISCKMMLIAQTPYSLKRHG